jgi:chromatin segregation and condensation protein Rec8/ScpA/Scc1 (kleisin family)
MSIWRRIRQAWERKLRRLRETEVPSQEEIEFFEKVRRVLGRIEEKDRRFFQGLQFPSRWDLVPFYYALALLMLIYVIFAIAAHFVWF